MSEQKIDPQLKARLIHLAEWALSGFDRTEDGSGKTDLDLIEDALQQIVDVLKDAGTEG